VSCVALDIGFELIVCRFTKMIFAIRKRFTGTDERTKLASQNGNDIAHVENGA